MQIILASKSPRRVELMQQIQLPVTVIPSTVEEKITKTAPAEVVEELSLQKAEDVATKLDDKGQSYIVIGADTVVSVDGEILGKPKDAEDAKRMLHLLQGRAHEVYTGVTCVYVDSKVDDAMDLKAGASAASKVDTKVDASANSEIGGKPEVSTFSVKTEVHVYPMSDAEIDAYVAGGDPMDKAGSYGIQGEFAKFIKGISGDYNNVVGLPVAAVYQQIKGRINDF